mmetsp:Transcript_21157/g.24039  ORF Transcript_21157/g.24039 Transcript_21157/m.24039 type:complete len:178 (-) Transcript_21157:174-707(-)
MENDGEATNYVPLPLSKEDKQKAKYIKKEQLNRLKMIEEENNKYLHSSYAPNRLKSISMQSTQTEATDCHDLDWTAEDSSYGAAFPFCGWIPKQIREAIEIGIYGLASFALIYLIVSIAILLSGDRDSSSSDKSSKLQTDDDFYITDDYFYVNNDNYYANDDGQAENAYYSNGTNRG